MRALALRISAPLSLLGLFLLALPARAQAPDDATLAAARKLGEDGVALYQKGDYSGASDKLERAYAVVKVPTLGLWSGRAFERLGKLVEASQRYREVTLLTLKASDSNTLRTAQGDAEESYEAISPRIPQLTLELDGATASDVDVSVDGKAIPSALLGAAFPVNPGAHQVEGRRGDQVVTETLTLGEGEQRSFTLVFGPAPAIASVHAVPTPADAAAAPQPAAAPTQAREGNRSALPWVVVGAGAAVAVTGGVFIALALGAKSTVESATNWKAVQSDNDKVSTYSTVGFVMAGVGAAAIAAGLVWKYTRPSGSEGQVSVQTSGSNLVLKGTF